VAECKYCAFAVYPPDTTPGCEFGLTFRVEDHPCPLWEREVGTDDDLGEGAEIASKASESAYTARSASTRHEGAS
jgi:hypothetical protein